MPARRTLQCLRNDACVCHACVPLHQGEELSAGETFWSFCFGSLCLAENAPVAYSHQVLAVFIFP